MPSWAKDIEHRCQAEQCPWRDGRHKPAFRTSFRRHRCLIPANGFYEWQADRGGGQGAEAALVHPSGRAGRPLRLCRSAGGMELAGRRHPCPTCILTTGPNAVMAPIHDRMPVILAPDQFDPWLDPDNPDLDGFRGLMQPCDSDLMAAHPVSPAINRGTVEGPECIKPFEVATETPCVALLLVLTSRGAVATTLEGRVVGVADGDTLTLLDSERKRYKIRLGGIDAPEDGQPFGQRSKENLSDMVFGKDVRVEWKRKKRDKYKRIVGKVWVQPESCPTCPMTLDHGHAQITAGLASVVSEVRQGTVAGGPWRVRILGTGGPGEARRAMERARFGAAMGVA